LQPEHKADRFVIPLGQFDIPHPHAVEFQAQCGKIAPGTWHDYTLSPCITRTPCTLASNLLVSCLLHRVSKQRRRGCYQVRYASYHPWWHAIDQITLHAPDGRLVLVYAWTRFRTLVVHGPGLRVPVDREH